jgi:pyruvate kinase
MKGVKIVCTIGPSSDSPDVIRALITSGMDVARLNFSHGTHEEHKEKINIIRSISSELNRPVAILQDLCGPKIRVGEICSEGIRLTPGQEFILTTEPIVGCENRVSVSHTQLPKDVRPEDRILLADGMMEIAAKTITQTEIRCEVITGGVLTSHKGINFPSRTLKIEAFTEKDRMDLKFGLDNDVDYVALSFVKSADEIHKVKDVIREKGRDTPVIAKIEKHEALTNIDEIIIACDGLMVARGDLGVEIPIERVPQIQKMLVKKANQAGIPVIIATQMMRSMVDAPRPTRAEASDVANAVLDGADAVMLSEETATGKHPVQSLQFISRFTSCTEEIYPHARYLEMMPAKAVANSVAYSSCVLADHLDAAAIVATTRSGFTAMKISRFRPRSKIIALSPELVTVRRLMLYWGCYPRWVETPQNTDERIEKAVQEVLKSKTVKKGDVVVITSGHPVWEKGTTNMLRVKEL